MTDDLLVAVLAGFVLLIGSLTLIILWELWK